MTSQCQHDLLVPGHTVRQRHRRVAEDCEETWLECRVCGQSTEAYEAPYWQQAAAYPRADWIDEVFVEVDND